MKFPDRTGGEQLELQFKTASTKNFTLKWSEKIKSRYVGTREGVRFFCFCFYVGDTTTCLCADGKGTVINVTNLVLCQHWNHPHNFITLFIFF